MNLGKIIASRPNKTVYRDGNKAVKLFNDEYSKSDVLNEALNQARVEETGLSVPKLHEVTKIDGKWAIVSDYIEGVTLSELIKNSAEKEDEYLNLFVEQQNKIFEFKAPLLNKLRDKMHRKIDLTDFNATTRYELHMRLNAKPDHDKICHGDFCPSNILVTSQNEYYIIDWAHVTQGNPGADAARTYLLFCLDGQEELAEKYLNLFSDKTGIAKQLVQGWMPIVAASQSVKKKDGQLEFLKRWVDVVEYE